MKLFWHFVQRDCRDNFIGWGLVVVLTFLHYFFFFSYAEKSLIGFYGSLAMLYYLFSLFQQMTVWGGGAGLHQSTLSRQYLQALPISRKRLFRIAMARSLVPALPLMIFLSLLPVMLADYPQAHSLWQAVVNSAQMIMYVTLVVIAVFFPQLTSCRLSLFNDVIRRTVGKGPRFLRYVQYIAVDNLLGIMAAFSPFLGILVAGVLSDPTFIWKIFIPGAIFNIWQLRRSYRQWLWE